MENKELCERLDWLKFIVAEKMDYAIIHLTVMFNKWVKEEIPERTFTDEARSCLDSLEKYNFDANKRLDCLLNKIEKQTKAKGARPPHIRAIAK